MTINNTKNVSLLYTRNYYDALEPVLNVLRVRKTQVTAGIWITMVHYKKEEIIQNPVRYLGIELSLRDEMVVTIDNIFHELLKHELLINS